MGKKLTVHVNRLDGPWVHAGPFKARMSRPWFSFRWPWKLPDKKLVDTLYNGVLGFSITWHSEERK